jgi:hypothetical protein
MIYGPKDDGSHVVEFRAASDVRIVENGSATGSGVSNLPK